MALSLTNRLIETLGIGWLASLSLIADSEAALDCNANGLPDQLDVVATPRFDPVHVPATNGYAISLTASAADPTVGSLPFDADGDGDTDLAVVNHIGVGTARPGVTVYYNDGLGDFTESRHFPRSDNDAALLVAGGDLNGDNRPDLVVVLSKQSVVIFLNDGSGGFAEQDQYPAGSDGLVLADLDTDGDLDIVTRGVGGLFDLPVILTLYNQGNGSFEEGPISFTGGAGVSSVAGDFDNDGDADLVVDRGPLIRLLLNQGDGRFIFFGDFEAGPGQNESVAAADLDNDGDLDVAVAKEGSLGISILHNDGFGILESAESHQIGAVTWLEPADLDGDGDIDLAGAGDGVNGPHLHILRNLGDGSFSGPQSFATGNLDFPPSLTSGDFNADGFNDLASVFVNGGSFPNLHVLLNDPVPPLDTDCNGNGILDSCDLTPHLDYEPTVAFSSAGCPVEVQSTAVDADHNVLPLDLNEDGLVDLVAGNEQSDLITILLNNGGVGPDWEGFTSQSFDPGPGNGKWTGIAAGDLDQDGHLDLVGSSVIDGELTILWGDGLGSFSEVERVDLSILGDPSTPDTVVADFDNDGRLDIAVTAESDDFLYLVEVGPARSCSIAGPLAVDTPRGLNFGDVNQDGAMDLVCATKGSGSVVLFFNEANGTLSFEPGQEIELGGEPFHVNLADLDLDTYPEILTVDQQRGLLRVLFNEGDGTFREPVDYAVPTDSQFSRPRFVEVADLNGDSLPDVATIDRGTPVGLASTFLNTGDGVLRPVQHFEVGDFPGGIVSGDYDSDGDQDLATADQFSDSVSVLLLDRVVPPTSDDANQNGIPDNCEGARPLPLLKSVHHEEGMIQLQWKGRAGVDYMIERSFSLTAPWTVLATRPGSGQIQEFTDKSLPANTAAAFYRVTSTP